MILHDIRGEKLVKPVGISEFGLLQVAVLRLGGVLQCETTRKTVISIGEFVHLSVYAILATIEHFREIEPTLVGHFSVNTHLFFGVEDVEVVV